MMRALALFSFAAAARAAVLAPRDCSFHIAAAGGADGPGGLAGPVGQRPGGQTAFGHIAASTFTIHEGGRMYDGHGRGCWWTPPTMVLQCDEGQAPEPGFTIDCNGVVGYRGQSTFSQCHAPDGLHNIYLAPNGINCGSVTLHADKCGSASPAKPKPASAPAPAPAHPAPVHFAPVPAPAPVHLVPAHPAPMHLAPVPVQAPAPAACPRFGLDGKWQFPHLIIPVDSAHPDQGAATSYNGNVTPTISSIFNFDVPADYHGKQCSLVFHFPRRNDLETSNFKFSGSGAINFAKLSGPAAQHTTTFRHQAAVEADYGVITVAPGHSYGVATFGCPAGQTATYRISVPAGCDTNLWWFQDYNPKPIGLYLTQC